MKTFLEEYGFVILIAVVVIMLVVTASPIGGTIKASVLGLVDSFGSRTIAKIDKANFQGLNYRIEYYLDGGVNDPSNPVTYEKDSGGIVLADPSKEGYTFDGWYTEPEFANKVTSIVNGTEGNIDLYAKFTKNKTYILKTGLAFNNLIPATTTSIVFTDETMPSSATLIDVDVDGDGGIVAWLDGTTFKVSTQKSGKKIILNEDSSYMFCGYRYAGNGTTTTQNLVSIDFGNVDTSNVTSMSNMFSYAGYNATNFSIEDLSNWVTSKVTNMSDMFYCAGFNATTFNLDISGWNTSKVTSMSNMFHRTGYTATTFNLDLSNWVTSKVTNMSDMFCCAGFNATTFNLDLSNWDVSHVTYMSGMFQYAGYKATAWSVGDLSGWNTSSVIGMSSMFQYAGYNATTFNLDLSGWNTSSVISMSYMFRRAGQNATYSLDLSGWNVDNVTSYSGFNIAVETKVTAPTWVN